MDPFEGGPNHPDAENLGDINLERFRSNNDLRNSNVVFREDGEPKPERLILQPTMHSNQNRAPPEQGALQIITPRPAQYREEHESRDLTLERLRLREQAKYPSPEAKQYANFWNARSAFLTDNAIKVCDATPINHVKSCNSRCELEATEFSLCLWKAVNAVQEAAKYTPESLSLYRELQGLFCDQLQPLVEKFKDSRASFRDDYFARASAVMDAFEDHTTPLETCQRRMSKMRYRGLGEPGWMRRCTMRELYQLQFNVDEIFVTFFEAHHFWEELDFLQGFRIKNIKGFFEFYNERLGPSKEQSADEDQG